MAMEILWGGLIGGAIAWTWGAISWMALPWHHATFLAFADEPDAARMALALCPVSGVYGLPAPPKPAPGMDKAAREAADRAAQARMQKGPILTAVVQRDGFGSVPLAMLRAFVIYAAAAAVMTWVLLQSAGQSYWERVALVTSLGFLAGLMCRLPDWNWHGYSTAYTIVNVVDHTITAGVVGLALARIV
jgi:hypothetical protein